MRLLPYRDKHGRRVYIYRSGVWNPETVTFEQGFATGYKILEMVSLEPKTQVGTTSQFVKVSTNQSNPEPGGRHHRRVRREGIRVQAVQLGVAGKSARRDQPRSARVSTLVQAR